MALKLKLNRHKLQPHIVLEVVAIQDPGATWESSPKSRPKQTGHQKAPWKASFDI